MAIDTNRVVAAAVEAALKEVNASKAKKQRRQLLPAKRALLLGAGLAVAGRLAVGSRGRDMLGAVQQRLSDLEQQILGEDKPLDEDLVDDEELDDEEEPEDDEEFADDEDLEDEAEFDDDEPSGDEEPVASE